MSARSILGIAAAAALLPLLLSGCGSANPSDTGGNGTPDPGSSESPTPGPDATGDAGPTALPADCAALVATADPGQFGDAPLNDPAFVPHGPSGVVTPGAPPANADARQTMRAIHELWCLWADPAADITHLSVEVGHLSEQDAAGLITGLEAEGYACAEAHGGTVCDIVTPNSQFPVDDEFTYLFRDDVVILVDQTNFPTNNLMGSMVEVIWG
jgi:hypothetical protein